MTENRLYTENCVKRGLEHHMKSVTLEEGGPDRTQAGIQITLIQVHDAPREASGAKGKA